MPPLAPAALSLLSHAFNPGSFARWGQMSHPRRTPLPAALVSHTPLIEDCECLCLPPQSLDMVVTSGFALPMPHSPHPRSQGFPVSDRAKVSQFLQWCEFLGVVDALSAGPASLQEAGITRMFFVHS